MATLQAPVIQTVSVSGDGNSLAHWKFFGGDDGVNVYYDIDRWDGRLWLRIGGKLPGSCAETIYADFERATMSFVSRAEATT